MTTRAAAAREAEFLASSTSDTAARSTKKDALQSETSPGGISQAKAPGTTKTATKRAIRHENGNPSPSSRKRKRGAPIKEDVSQDWNELPHNMGLIKPTNSDKNDNLESASKKRVNVKVEDEGSKVVHSSPPRNTTTKKSSTPKRRQALAEVKGIIKNDNQDLLSGGVKEEEIIGIETVPNHVKSDEDAAVVELTKAGKPRKPRAPKRAPYGLTPGKTPFPDFEMPTIEAAAEVNRLLSELHGEVKAPKEIPAPSLDFAGCGEVPSVLDALIRTLLSAATTGRNSAAAFKGLVETYGLCEEGIGKGSVNWNKVRDSSQPEVEAAIRSGGLAKAKSTNIKKILDIVHETNVQRKDAFEEEKRTGKPADVLGADSKTQGQKDLEIETAKSNILSLQYMHGMDPEVTMTEFIKLPGIGVKTASCVMLFCLQSPSFAVDTHVWRLCKWLGWVPENATRDQTFSHCEVRIPNELKYSLHQLFIKHGKTCGRCRAATGESSQAWEDTKCPIEHLVARTGARKGVKSPTKSPKSKSTSTRRKKPKVVEGDGDSEAEDELTEEEFDSGVESE